MRGTLLASRVTYILQEDTQREAQMARLVRKNVLLDPKTLARARRILGKRSESEAIREALELVAFRQAVLKGFDRVAGKARDFGEAWIDR